MNDSEYFKTIEMLGELVCESVRSACGQSGGDSVRKLESGGSCGVLSCILDKTDKLADRIMQALESDFVTPIGRGDLSAVVMSLRRAVLAAVAMPPGGVCGSPGIAAASLALAGYIEKSAGRLRGLRKKKPLPSAADYFEASHIPVIKPPGAVSGRAYPAPARTRPYSPSAMQSRADSAELRLYDSLCACCETLIIAAMNNI